MKKVDRVSLVGVLVFDLPTPFFWLSPWGFGVLGVLVFCSLAHACIISSFLHHRFLIYGFFYLWHRLSPLLNLTSLFLPFVPRLT